MGRACLKGERTRCLGFLSRGRLGLEERKYLTRFLYSGSGTERNDDFLVLGMFFLNILVKKCARDFERILEFII
jgi:hypothetical protein